MRRFTIDLDTRSIRSLWETISRTKQVLHLTWREMMENTLIRHSRKKGYHVQVLYDWEIPKRMLLLYRVYCGDDPRRVYLDMTRKGAPTNILFNTDAGKEIWVGKKWRERK